MCKESLGMHTTVGPAPTPHALGHEELGIFEQVLDDQLDNHERADLPRGRVGLRGQWGGAQAGGGGVP